MGLDKTKNTSEFGKHNIKQISQVIFITFAYLPLSPFIYSIKPSPMRQVLPKEKTRIN